MPEVATPLSSDILELPPKPTCARELPKRLRLDWPRVVPARPVFLPRFLQRITSIMSPIPPTSEPAPTAIASVSVLPAPAPASGTESPALIVGGITVTIV